jgi:tRNA G18 (ribose-2'-O)-methylase SpoU
VPVIPVADPLDARLEHYRNVPDGELLAQRGLFIAEGRLVVERLLTSPAWETRSVLVTETARAALHDVLEAREDLAVYVAPQALLNAVAGLNIHRGALAVGRRPVPRPWQAVAEGTSRIVALERIGNPDNVGAIFRSAAAFGVGGVLLDTASADPLYRKAIRTSMGATLAIPFASIVPEPGVAPTTALADTLGGLGNAGWTVVGLTPTSDAPALSAALSDLRNARVAFLVGHEGATASRESRCQAGASRTWIRSTWRPPPPSRSTSSLANPEP